MERCSVIMLYNKCMKKLGVICLVASLFITPFGLSAQTVDLLWQGETYTPPFYEGRSLWSKQSIITISAIPHGLGAAQSLNYKWSTDGKVLGVVSGVGRNTLSFSDTLFSRPQTIRVQVMGEKNTVLAESSTVIIPTNAETLVYEKNPLLGYMFHQEVGEGLIINDKEEITLAGFPLFTFPAVRDGANLTYSWSTNSGERVIGNSVTYKIPEEDGSSLVSLIISNSELIVENMKREFLIKYEE